MIPLYFEHFCGKDFCTTGEEVRAVLAKDVDGFNEFIIADAPAAPGDSPYPYLSVLVKGDCAYLWYAPDDSSAGLQVYGPEDSPLDPEDSTVFHITPAGEQLWVGNCYVCPRQTALEVVLAWMALPAWPACLEEMPGCVEWEEL